MLVVGDCYATKPYTLPAPPLRGTPDNGNKKLSHIFLLIVFTFVLL
jgi:hypothetical protein